jgi:DNA-directed RNA polymerase subunit alpha
MRIRWRNLELPSRVICREDSKTLSYGFFEAEPFERGFGVTVGNSLRRVLLSSIEGTAVTSVKISGVKHEFSTIPGVVEDVADIILNVKQLKIMMHDDGPKVMKIAVKKKGEVKAADIEEDPTVEIINPDLVIATLGKEKNFKMEMEVKKGRGYVTSEENESENGEIGVIPIDSIFSPVVRVKYRAEHTRVGKMTDYDKLLMEVWTDGTISPEYALVEASKILRKHLNPFVQYYELGQELQKDRIKEEEDKKAEKERRDLEEKLQKPITELDFSARASNCLKTEGIETVRDLVNLSEATMLEFKNFGKTSLREVKKKLSDLNLTLGMEMGGLSKDTE